MNTLYCELSKHSDSHASFEDLYKHRNTLFLLLMAHHPNQSWISEKHHDGTRFDGYFIAGMKLDEEDVTYHIPDNMWPLAKWTGATVLDKGRLHDGHDPHEVWQRLYRMLQGIYFNMSHNMHSASEVLQKKSFDSYRDDILTAPDILQYGLNAIKDRAASRDMPGERSMARAVKIFKARTGIELNEYEGWIFMACLKAARSTQGKFNLDDYIDEAAYIALAAECLANQPKTEKPE